MLVPLRPGRLGPVRLAAPVAGSFGLVVALAATTPAGPPPAVTNLMARLTGVGASSPSDALAVGFSIDSHGTQRAVALHWNGTQWAQVAVPKATGSELDGVTTPSASDAWAVGLGSGHAAAGGLILHWDGSAWTRMPSPRPRPHHSGVLHAVTADSGSDAWAVGDDLVGSPLQVTDLALHWDGT